MGGNLLINPGLIFLDGIIFFPLFFDEYHFTISDLYHLLALQLCSFNSQFLNVIILNSKKISRYLLMFCIINVFLHKYLAIYYDNWKIFSLFASHNQCILLNFELQTYINLCLIKVIYKKKKYSCDILSYIKINNYNL